MVVESLLCDLNILNERKMKRLVMTGQIEERRARWWHRKYVNGRLSDWHARN